MNVRKQAIAGTTIAGIASLCCNVALADVTYPVGAAGWGPDLGNGRMASRWAEDWSAQREAGKAPRFKAMPLGETATLTLSGEVRLRGDAHRRSQLSPANHYEQALLRAIAGADLRFNPHVRIYGELGTAQARGRRSLAAANLQNDLALQQGFLELGNDIAGAEVGVMLGRQEFGDGPRQLISLGDGPNLRRTWNGARGYAVGNRWRFGVFKLRTTKLVKGGLDEETNHGETLHGATAGFILANDKSSNAYLEPFWYRTDHNATRLAGRVGRDERDTRGMRIWGRNGDLRYDWTLAHQGGSSQNREVDAWGVFGVHSYALSNDGWKPRLTARVDVASGGGSYGSGTVRAFNPLYASSNYIGEGQFLGLTNLAMITPGITVNPTAKVTLSFDYGFARRLKEGDAVYGGAMRPHAGTQTLAGDDIGNMMRLIGSWAITPTTTLFFNVENLRAGELLRRARLRNGRYMYVGATFRY